MKISNKVLELNIELTALGVRGLIETTLDLKSTTYNIIKFRKHVEDLIGEPPNQDNIFVGVNISLSQVYYKVLSENSINNTKLGSKILDLVNMVVDISCNNYDNSKQSEKVRKIRDRIVRIKKEFELEEIIDFYRKFFDSHIEEVTVSTILRKIMINIMVFIIETNSIIKDIDYSIVKPYDSYTLPINNTNYVLKSICEFRSFMILLATSSRAVKYLRKNLLNSVREEFIKDKKFTILNNELNFDLNSLMGVLINNSINCIAENYLAPRLYIKHPSPFTEYYFTLEIDLNQIIKAGKSVIETYCVEHPNIMMDRKFLLPSEGVVVKFKEDPPTEVKEIFIKEVHDEKEDFHKIIIRYKYKGINHDIEESEIIVDILNIEKHLYCLSSEMDFVAFWITLSVLGIMEDIVENLNDEFIKIYNKDRNEIESQLDWEILNIVKRDILGKFSEMKNLVYYEVPVHWNYNNRADREQSKSSLNKPKAEKKITVNRFTKSLPQGWEASEEAKAYAKKYCINLEGKTIVKTHERRVKVYLD